MARQPGNPGPQDPIALATARQHEASRPGMSVVLGASAGSGKTHALVSRFLRLCIESPGPEGDGPAPEPVHPRAILAVTFTRKAAVEIRARLLKEAVALATASPQDLEERLAGLFGERPAGRPTGREMSRAASLYEMILENPSGLKVGTIHHFCQLILGRFAAEAGLDPRFTVIEDRDELVDEALDRLDREMATDDGLSLEGRRLGKDPAAVRHAVREVFTEQMRLQRWLDRTAGPEDRSDHRTRLLGRLLTRLRTELFPGLGGTEPSLAELMAGLASELETFAGPGLGGVIIGLGSAAEGIPATNPGKLGDKAREAAAACRDAAAGVVDQDGGEAAAAAAAEQARLVLLTKEGKLRVFFQGRKDPDLVDRYQSLIAAAAGPVFVHLRTLAHRELYLRNRSLLTLGLRALDIYDTLKRRDRGVDFQDLEDLARRLMGDEARAMSLLFRLDDSIAHILVDEFQDTNFNQRDIISPFVEDFLAGGSGQTALPTVFFVGDGKQSIYGFRGAEPRLFAGYADRFGAGAPGLATLSLPTNFRSLEAVVAGVGDLFEAEPLAGAMGPAAGGVRQAWAREADRGKFEVITPCTVRAPDPENPADELSGDQVAAETASAIVRSLHGTQETWDRNAGPGAGRPLEWQDFLVLFRSRNGISIYEEAFRRADIPIAPSGRGMLAASREVQDLLALLRWLNWPDDDVALATVLRSPIFRWSEEDLQAVLTRRKLQRPDGKGGFKSPQRLWEAVAKDPQDALTGPAADLLGRWRHRAGFEHCHDLLRRIFREADLLERYRSALGDQAVFNLMRLHDLALGPELAATPTIRRLAELIHRAGRFGGQEEGAVPEGTGGGRVRFLTIHGAKGLQAPVVLLVDADRKTGRESPRISLDPDDSCSPLLMKVGVQDRKGFELPPEADVPPDPIGELAAAAALRDQAEEANLVYVALTRAQDRLYVLGGDRSGRSAEHDSALRRIIAGAEASGSPHVTVTDAGDLELPQAVEARPQKDPVGPAPGGLNRRVWTPPSLGERIRILTPSSAAQGRGDLLHEDPRTDGHSPDRDSAPGGIQHGLLVHRWLQAAADTGRMPAGIGPDREEAAAVFGDEALAWVFRPEGPDRRGMSEAPVIARRPSAGDGQPEERITGVIDRLVLQPGRVDIIDYKTNRCGPGADRQADLVEHYRPQLAMYCEAVALLRPDCEIHAWLLFTDPELPAKRRLICLD